MATSAQTLEVPGPVRAERRRILSSLLEQVDLLAETAVTAIWAEIPAYAAQDDPRFLDDVREQVKGHYRTMLSLFLDEREVKLEDIAFVRGAATRRARDGFALQDYINAYRVGQQVLWEAIVGLAGETSAGHEAALPLATPVMRYLNFASTYAGNAYVEFQQYVVADADRVRRDLLEHLLAGRMPRRGPLLEAARQYGLGSTSRALVAVAVPVGRASDSDAPDAASAAIARAGLRKTLVVVRQAEIVAVPALGKATDPAELCDRLETVQERLRDEGMALAIGVSTIASGVGELPRAYSEARAAVEYVAVGGGVAALPRLSLFHYLTLRADDTSRRMIDPRLRAFLDEDRRAGGTLAATVRAFAAADLNLRVAAERLHVHLNTARYRLNRIEERTGRNPRHIADLLDLLAAINVEDVNAAP